MLYLLVCFSALASPVEDASSAYTRGMSSLKQKNADEARSAFTECLEIDASRNDCLWELGWAHWLTGDWSDVVTAWETLAERSPKHDPSLQSQLSVARAQANLSQEILRLRTLAPPRVSEDSTGSVRLRAVGDVMLGTDFPDGYLPPNDGAHLLDDVSSLLTDADLTFANLEGPLCDGGKTTKCKPGGNCYAFRSPTLYGRYLKDAGIDVVSTANNHARDFGEYCRLETHKTLDSLDIAWSGPPGTTATLEQEGIRVGWVAFHTDAGSNHLNNTETAVELVSALATSHPIVVVSFHGGAEGSKAIHTPNGTETFYGEDRGNLRLFTHAVVDAGADLVLGHGPHVPRAMEIYKDRLIAYSLGNFATYGRFNLSGHLGKGMILEVEMDSVGTFVAGRVLSTSQRGRGIPEVDTEGRAADLVRMLSSQDFPETGVIVGQDGSIAAQK